MFHLFVLFYTTMAGIANPNSRRYVSQVGILSLESLFLGSVILFFVASNTPWSWDHPMIFKTGSHLPVQFWLAVLGVGFSLLAFGLSESYVHLFDVWCTWKAGSDSGLDYARYLNTQPRAPVVVGFRGFRPFVMVRYLIILLGIAGSIGYKFAIVQITEMSLELDETAVTVHLPSAEPIDLATGATSTWLRDGPTAQANRAFRHFSSVDGHHTDIAVDAMDRMQPPGVIFMFGEGLCSDTFHKFDEGILTTLELVVVANLEVERRDPNDFVELVPGGWTRVARRAAGWLEGSSDGLIIDYRHEENGTLNIRWAEIPEWADEERGTFITRQPINRGISYTIGLTLAEVSRVVASKDCGELKEVWPVDSLISTIPLGPPATQNNQLLNTLLKDPKISILDGVGLIVRNSMTTWGHAIHASERPNYTPGHAPVPSERSRWDLVPLASEKHKGNHGGKYFKKHGRPGAVYLESNVTFPRDFGDPRVAQAYSWMFLPQDQNHPVSYPYYEGTSVQNAGVGGYSQAAVIFIILGVIGCSLILVRLYLGPAGITSWMGQHVYLALEGRIQRDGSEILACGHQVAQDLGTVRIEKHSRIMNEDERNTAERVESRSSTGLWIKGV
ncbi:uncharacterized protein PODANS_5_7930 [Podospora anserina S mat+]|uniref:Podospora anserina S mat+ genomic DNA chromosome 5, supercontig 9 n=1 Tax=Podospora anserina (strain S / ATCC MYA-4624 / DSM 980 / FGSC 10383) TaxID=515849 RepID=B2AKI8_PODAN|nr:uncharacterized protein PODANS_5_7930 [Podospora anserina S mat+]CAP64509.1 unnamed protein product [Podospora anserina S mat+]CDP29906.1 Putative protein of unknown function [Podospora anserina S mat+]